MVTRIRTLLALFLVTLLVGCATPTHMPLASDTDSIKVEAGPVFLVTTSLKNDYRTSFQPKLIVAHVEKTDAKDRADRLNFTMDAKAKVEADTPEAGNRYLLRLQLQPGSYVIRGFTGFSGIFPIRGHFFAPLHADLSVSQAGGVYYLGDISATVRERNDGEFRAGPPIPLLDQAVAGFSGGTFDVTVTDRLEQDLPELLRRFPALRAAKIEKRILPAFDRSKAQKFWEAN